jgi:hypothetical protein
MMVSRRQSEREREKTREERDSAIRPRYCEIASTGTCYALQCTKSRASDRTINYQYILLSPYCSSFVRVNI